MIVFGTNFQGKIKALAGQAIKTKFFHICWIPILPLGSMFTMDEDGDEVQGFEIKLSFLSTLLAYLRGYLGVLCLVVSIRAFDDGFNWKVLTLTAVLVLIWAIFMFVVGRAGKEEKYDRTLLGLGTGVFAYPGILPEKAARDIFESLETTWKEDPDNEMSPDWRQSISSKFTNSKNIPLLFSLASYRAQLEKDAPDAAATLQEARKWALRELPQEEILELDLDGDDGDD